MDFGWIDHILSCSPWEELRLVEDFLGLDNELTQERFQFNATKGFYCMKQVDRLRTTLAVKE